MSRRILVIGGGIGGMAAAISLRQAGFAVDLVEIDPQWQAAGAGISISPATFRALARLGIAPALIEQGYFRDGFDIFDIAGNHLLQMPTPRLAGPELPSGGGIMRPVLREILGQATIGVGARVRLGVSFETLNLQPAGVDVRFTDGTEGRYDLVVGADGIGSRLRQSLFPEAPPPRFTGQGCWRAVVPRPASVVRSCSFMGIHDKAGVNPVSQAEMYMYLNARESASTHMEPAQLPALLAQRLAPYGGLIATIRESLDAGSRVVYRPLDMLLVPSPWYRGRVVLIGDAVHATTPHLANGAGIAVEDGIVLAEELTRSADIDRALDAFMQRRFPRCRMVVENSVRLGQLEQAGGSQPEHQELMRQSMEELARAF